MHDIHGKTLHIGNEVFSYGFGLCKIVGVIQEDNIEKQGALVTLESLESSKQFTARLVVAGVFKVRTWAELAKEALDVQNACNLTAVLHSFQQASQEVRVRMSATKKAEFNTSAFNRHPINQLYSDKIASLSGTQFDAPLRDAYNWAFDVSNFNKTSVNA